MQFLPSLIYISWIHVGDLATRVSAKIRSSSLGEIASDQNGKNKIDRNSGVIIYWSSRNNNRHIHDVSAYYG